MKTLREEIDDLIHYEHPETPLNILVEAIMRAIRNRVPKKVREEDCKCCDCYFDRGINKAIDQLNKELK